jgi:hypothetical protein
MSSKNTIPPDRLGYSVTDALQTGAFPNRNKLYLAIGRGDIESWKDGRSRIISADSLREYVQRKVSEAA